MGEYTSREYVCHNIDWLDSDGVIKINIKMWV